MINPIILAEEVISREDLISLLEYSCSTPSIATIGLQWRCANNGASFRDQEDTKWFIRTYVQDPHDEKMALIVSVWAVDENHEPHRGDLRD